MAQQEATSMFQHTEMREFGKTLSVVRVGGPEQYLIGTQVASLLKRETFNMYRSMKIKKIPIQRATPEQVEYLTKCGAVKPGTHSVTLIPLNDGLYFAADAWYRQHRFETPYVKSKSNKVRSFLTERPKLDRRKAHPWNVHRALKAGDVQAQEASAAVQFNVSTPSLVTAAQVAAAAPAPAAAKPKQQPAPAALPPKVFQPLHSMASSRTPFNLLHSFSMAECPDDLPGSYQRPLTHTH
eukprot:TRINITY_DN607_c1_g1_i1.p1 TRINITY_DN607_c1_g1~~TRINITY_DN607_c1_g1_i1.p1  ORF type:complete len:239 (-),score=91.12 TRINITY_DN607_c1_g1_i1:454-1170(-)